VKVRDLVEDINVASKEQAVAMSQLNDGMGQISAATENMSTRSQETAGSAVQLKNLASELKGQISKFKLCEDTETAAPKNADSWDMEELNHQIDEELRNEIADILKKGKLPVESAEQLASWDPYDQNGVSPFFDPEWMFDVKDGFDVVIGNPPYIKEATDKSVFDGLRNTKCYQGKWIYGIYWVQINRTY
jgi:Methyl-accepting chemotaxis protein